MKKNELRIGNLVYQVSEWGEKLSETKLTEWNEGIWYRIGECLAYLEDYQPIPLTEEWLIKFGFKHSARMIWDIPNTEYSFSLDRFCLWDYTGDEGYLISTDLNYVHQLQNICFALTGEELKIKE